MGGGDGVEIEAPNVLRRKGPRIVVVGGGFGGVYASTYLAQSELATRGAEITLVDPKNFFTFTPLLAEVTGGTLRREHVIHPLRVLARKYGFDVRRETVSEVDPDGVIRLVVAHRDPGVPNWLDTTGHAEGFLTPRWAYSETPPTERWPRITAKKVPFDEIRKHLHEDTRRVSPEERREQIRIRQRHVQRRYRVF